MSKTEEIAKIRNITKAFGKIYKSTVILIEGEYNIYIRYKHTSRMYWLDDETNHIIFINFVQDIMKNETI